MADAIAIPALGPSLLIAPDIAFTWREILPLLELLKKSK